MTVWTQLQLQTGAIQMVHTHTRIHTTDDSCEDDDNDDDDGPSRPGYKCWLVSQP